MKSRILFYLTTIFLVLTTALFFLGQLSRVTFQSVPVNLYAYEIGLGAVFCFLVARFGFSPLKKRFAKIVSGFLLYLTLTSIMAAFSYSLIKNVVSFLYLLRLSVYLLFFVYLQDWWKAERFSHGVGKKLILIFITWTIGTGFIQYFLYANLQNLYYLGWDPHLYRMFGLYFEPAVAAGVYGLLAFYLLIVELSVKTKWWRYIFIPILLVMLFLTYSRSAFLGIIVALVIWVWKKKSQRYLLLVVAVAVVFLFVSPRRFGEGMNLWRTSTIASRLADYRQGFAVWKKKPFLGIGYNHIREEKREVVEDKTLIDISHSGASFHSSFLIILVTGGIIGLLWYLYFLKNLLAINSAAFYGGIYLTVLSLFDNIFLHPLVLILYLVLVSLG